MKGIIGRVFASNPTPKKRGSNRKKLSSFLVGSAKHPLSKRSLLAGFRIRSMLADRGNLPSSVFPPTCKVPEAKPSSKNINASCHRTFDKGISAVKSAISTSITVIVGCPRILSYTRSLKMIPVIEPK